MANTVKLFLFFGEGFCLDRSAKTQRLRVFFVIFLSGILTVLRRILGTRENGADDRI
jgi:hypothetical protein